MISQNIIITFNDCRTNKNKAMWIPVGVNQIKSITYDPSILKTLHDTTCPICIEEFVVQQKIIQFTKCKHIFHNKCIIPWLSRNHTCPLCRKVLRPTLKHVWVSLPQGFVPSPHPYTPALWKLLMHENMLFTGRLPSNLDFKICFMICECLCDCVWRCNSKMVNKWIT